MHEISPHFYTQDVQVEGEYMTKEILLYHSNVMFSKFIFLLFSDNISVKLFEPDYYKCAINLSK